MNFGERQDGTYIIRGENVTPKSIDLVLAENDVTWIDKDGRDYRVVTDEEEFESLVSYYENLPSSCLIAYDTETTGLHINCNGKRKSKYEKALKEWHDNNPDSEHQYIADRLTGVILCADEGKSYYFSIASVKFRNLCELAPIDKGKSPSLYAKVKSYRDNIIYNTISYYRSLGEHEGDLDLKMYFLDLANELESTNNEGRKNEILASVDSDILVMERLRKTFETHGFIGHNVGFDWKVSFLYGIDVHFEDDTLLLAKHIGKDADGGKISLKNLTHTYLGLPQLELSDFFTIKKDSKGYVDLAGYGSKLPTLVDFSFLEYDAVRYYAPADGDMTLRLKNTLYKEIQEDEETFGAVYTAYAKDVLCAIAVGYVEFYGHTLDLVGMKAVEIYHNLDTIKAESNFWKSIGLETKEEEELLADLDNLIEKALKLTESADDEEQRKQELVELGNTYDKLREDYDTTQQDRKPEDRISLGSAVQMSKLFYDRLGYKLKDGMKRGVGKDPIKYLLLQKDADGNPLKGVKEFKIYGEAKSVVTKFCNSLPYYTYPTGIVNPSFRVFGTDTGRMSCIAEGCMISLPNGELEIEKVRQGMEVFCLDDNNNLTTRKVLSVIDQGTKECICVKFDSENTTRYLFCTSDHKILCTDGNWVEAKDLDNKEVYGINVEFNNTDIYKATVMCSLGEKKVYDLEIDEFHNFIAEGVVVHNCSKPNAQQYPEEVTRLIKPRENCIMVDCDYSQIESRVITSMANENAMAEYFKDPDMDYHTRMASMLFNTPYEKVDKSMRKQSKSLNFGIPYGMGTTSLAAQLFGDANSETIEIAKARQESYFAVQPGIKNLFNRAIAEGRKNAIHTHFGRTRYLVPIPVQEERAKAKGTSFNKHEIEAKHDRYAKNTKIQGTAADIFKTGVNNNFQFIRKYNLYGKVMLIDLVHDEQVMEVDTHSLDALSVAVALADNMRVLIEGYCPLYAAATLGHDLHGAKKDEEIAIHPVELAELVSKFGLYKDNYSPWRSEEKDYETEPCDTESVLVYLKNYEIDFNKRYVVKKVIKQFGENDTTLGSAYSKLLMGVGVCVDKKTDESGKTSKEFSYKKLGNLVRNYLYGLPLDENNVPSEKVENLTLTLKDFLQRVVLPTDYMLGKSEREIVNIDKSTCESLIREQGVGGLLSYCVNEISKGKPVSEKESEAKLGLDSAEYMFAYINGFNGSLSQNILEDLLPVCKMEKGSEEMSEALKTIIEKIADFTNAMATNLELAEALEDNEEMTEEELEAYTEKGDTIYTKSDYESEAYKGIKNAERFGYCLVGRTFIFAKSIEQQLDWFMENRNLSNYANDTEKLVVNRIDDTNPTSAGDLPPIEVADERLPKSFVDDFIKWYRNGCADSPYYMGDLYHDYSKDFEELDTPNKKGGV